MKVYLCKFTKGGYKVITVENVNGYTILELIYMLEHQTKVNTEILNVLKTEGFQKELENMIESGDLELIVQQAYDKSKRVSVKSYGAKGDGKTDDTEAIQNCLAYCIEKGYICYFPNGHYLVNKGFMFGKSPFPTNTDLPVIIEGENPQCVRVDLKEGITLSQYDLFDFRHVNNIYAKNIKSNLGYTLTDANAYFEGEVAWRLALRNKEIFLENMICEGDYVRQGYLQYLQTKAPDSYERFTNPEYQTYPLEITNGSGYNAININNFATTKTGEIASPQDNSAIGIVDAVNNSTGVIFVDMIGQRSFERFVKRGALISSNLREGTVYEVHHNGHLAIGCSTDENEYGWNTIKVRDNSPSIRLIDANNNNKIMDIRYAKQDWGDEFSITQNGYGLKFYFANDGSLHFSGLGSGGLDDGLVINQSNTPWTTGLKIKHNGQTHGIGFDDNAQLRIYYDAQADNYGNGKVGTLIQKCQSGTERPELLNSWTDIGFCFFDTGINKPIWWTGTHWVDSTGQQV